VIFSLVALLGYLPHVFAAACCSGSALVPSLITTDSAAQFALRTSHAAVIGSSRSDGSSLFHRASNSETTETLTFSGAYALDPRWQIHGEVLLQHRARDLDSVHGKSSGFGDVSAGGAFEAVEELYYSVWKPRVWLFTDLSAPTGRAASQSREGLRSDVFGRGAWAATLGIFALKTWRAFDVFLLGEHRRYFLTREVTTPGPTTAFDIGVGYNVGDWRFGFSCGPLWDVRVSADGATSTDSLVWNLGAQLSYAFGESWSMVASYNDQTLVGPTYNSPLLRSVGLLASLRFD